MLKMTRQRKALLDLLEKQKAPLSAEMIYAKLPSGTMNLSTVYRILESFISYHLIDKTFLDNIAYYKVSSLEHKHYMVCLDCHQMFEMDCHFHGIAEDEAIALGFQIAYHDLTVYGYCKECQQKHTN